MQSYTFFRSNQSIYRPYLLPTPYLKDDRPLGGVLLAKYMQEQLGCEPSPPGEPWLNIV